MRVSRQQVLENKRTILEAAGRLFRERGFDAVTVTDVMKAAGLTHGGFYGYFKNKDDLIARTLAELQGETEPPSVDLATLAEQYLSPEHRDNFACGCPVAALASETIRQPGGARAEMTAGLKRQIERLSQVAPGSGQAYRRRAAIGSWAAMVGALILARMSDDSELSNEVLTETRAWLDAQDEREPKPDNGGS
ncbi:TetR family transcriptional regulator [Mesorhizobium sp. L-8-10]|uniref:TetR/AcrR family transcriptional regulator n=1 Tax=Mesorhizobium sp. L-8-10 TaxID=2744523 RepID=UPI0019287B1D|nr:TetR/AcrR family transcriptional regulator [Mesorhizobium sp. L-8-10]BCH34439.1 TetR family transcriptional regulator [Mesorhizobium sp. L-8-10]